MERRIMEMKDTKIREEGGKRYLEGYFAVFDKPYRVFDGWEETIAPGAFRSFLDGGQDVKVLWNHNHDIVLGSTENQTAVLQEDEAGLFGSVEINERDQEAVNAYERVARGDVRGCSFGFDIENQEEKWDENGVLHTRIIAVSPLYEVSPCTFPAYEATSVEARHKEDFEKAKETYERAKEERRSKWREDSKKRLKGER